MRRLGDFLGRTAGIRVGQVLHSGKTRAAQTAVILAETLLPSEQPSAREGLGPTDPLEKLFSQIGFWSLDTLIVGHLPYLGRLASLLLVADPDRPLLALQPGSMACLEKNGEGHRTLAWMIRPELLAPGRA